jgi:dTDP-4-dehydrorhamnose reductase
VTLTDAILVLGRSGQVGHELIREASSLGRIVAPSHRELDIGDADALRETVRRVRPAIVLNAAAYTAVDAAESDAERCFSLNARAPGVLAEECRAIGALLVHFSTDYVFDGAKSTPYVETDATRPLGVYGRSKLEGEQAVEAIGGAFLIFRTSWIYAPRGRNFVLTMLRLAHERTELAVVNDQVGAPTSAAAVAHGVAQALATLRSALDFYAACEAASGIYHMTAGGSATWYEFAKAVLAGDPHAPTQTCRSVRPITTAEYPTPAKRPAYSVLDCGKIEQRFGVRLPSWQSQWSAVARELNASH